MNILFLCVANSARSQMAEGLAKSILGPDFCVESAGSAPSGKVHQDAITVMKEEGIDISHHTSKSYEDLSVEFLSNLDLVITLCAEEVCPTVTSKAKRVSWGMPDPASVDQSERLDFFRNTRDRIKAKIQELR